MCFYRSLLVIIFILISIKGYSAQTVEINAPLKKFVAHLDLNPKAQVFDEDILDGLKKSIKYYSKNTKTESAPFTRIDTWILNEKIRPGDYVESKKRNFFIKMELQKGQRVIFVRQFANEASSLLAPVISPRDFPWDASMLDDLQVGDMAILPIKMTFRLSSDLGLGAGLPLFFSSNAKRISQYYLSGEFVLSILKVDNEHIKVKIVAQRDISSERGRRGQIKLSLFRIPGLDEFDQSLGVETFVEEQLFSQGKKFFNNMIQELAVRQKSKILNSVQRVGVEYLLDITDADARAAYDHLFMVRKNIFDHFPFKNILASLKQNLDSGDVDTFFSDLSVLDQIADEDRSKPVEDRRVECHLKFSGEFEQTVESRKSDLLTFHKSSSQISEVGKIVFYNQQGEAQNLLINSQQKVGRHQRSFFGFKKVRESRSQKVFSVSSSDGSPIGAGLIYNLSDNYLDRYEQKKIIAGIGAVLTPEAEALLFKRFSKNERKDVKVVLEIFFRSGRENLSPDLSIEQLFSLRKNTLPCLRLTVTSPKIGQEMIIDGDVEDLKFLDVYKKISGFGGNLDLEIAQGLK